MRRLGPFVNAILCTVFGIVVAQGGVRFMLKLFAVLMNPWISRNDGLGMAAGLAIWFVARGIVAAAASVASAYLFAHRWPVLGKWPVPATVSAVLSATISLMWAAYEFST